MIVARHGLSLALEIMLPLLGRRILVTRSQDQASELGAMLMAQGARPILVPAIEVVAPISFASLDDGIRNLARYDWLVLTSANGVTALQQRCEFHGLTVPSHVATAVIGAATARAAAKAGLAVRLTPPEAVQESLAQLLIERVRPGSRLLLVLAADARKGLSELLRGAGLDVTIAEAYRTRVPAESIATLREVFGEAESYPDAITFTSSSTATNLLALLRAGEINLPPDVVRASIGPITTQTLSDLNLPPHLEAREASIPALVDALVEHFVR